MTIQLLVNAYINNNIEASGSQHTLSEAVEADLIFRKIATRVGAPNYAINRDSAAVENGFENRTTSSIAFVEATRTFTITAIGNCYYWSNGVSYLLPASASVVIPDITGIHSIYFDGSTLTVAQAFNETIITDYAFVAAIYWDTVDDVAVIFGDERHGRTMDSDTHRYLHATRGARWASGMTPISITSNGNGDLAAHAQIGIEAGVMWDEDIKFEWPADALPLAAPLIYRNGATGEWRKIPSTGYLVTTTGTGRAAYNQNTSGTAWQLTELTNNNYVLSHLIATNDARHPFVWIVGQDDYATIALARTGADTEFQKLNTGGLASLFAEFVFVATFVVQTVTGYANAVKSRVQPLADSSQFVDLRRK